MSNIKIKTEGFEELAKKIGYLAQGIDTERPIMKATNILYRATVAAIPPNLKSMAHGVKESYDPKKAQGKVHIMGDWRLRFFEKGTQYRVTKAGFNRGRISPPLWFFRNANTSVKDQVIETFKKEMYEEIKQIWDK